MAHGVQDTGRPEEQASAHLPSGTDLSILLRGVPLFADLADPDLERLLVGAAPLRLDTGAAAFHQGDEARTFQVLLTGRLKLSQVTSDGQQVTLRYITPGEMFGGIAALNGKPYPASALAVAPSLAVRWDREVFQRHVQEQARLSWKLIQELSRRFSEAQSRFREMATERVERRIARTLLRLAHQTGRRVEEGVLIDLPLSRQDLAEMIGTTQFTVSRVLSDWERRGLVEAGRARVVLRHPHQLVLVAEDLMAPEV